MEKEKSIIVNSLDEQPVEKAPEAGPKNDDMQDMGSRVVEAVKRLEEAGQTEAEVKSGKEIVPNFTVDPKNYPIFSRQAGNREDFDKKIKSRTLSINETLGLMAGRTAETVAMLSGDVPGVPKADHVIYLDKSARPVSWLVNEFWEDFTNEEKSK